MPVYCLSKEQFLAKERRAIHLCSIFWGIRKLLWDLESYTVPGWNGWSGSGCDIVGFSPGSMCLDRSTLITWMMNCSLSTQLAFEHRSSVSVSRVMLWSAVAEFGPF